MKNQVIINEQHSLFDEQIELLNKLVGDWERLNVPQSGWTLEEIQNIAYELYTQYCKRRFTTVFASPIPAMLKEILTYCDSDNVLVFHNDTRVKKELPNGKVIMTISPVGWQLV